MRLCIILLAGLLFCACKRRDIVLDITWHMPGYMENTGLFGEDIKAMEERNAFLLETGKIDTTDEHPPVKVALVSINKKMIQLYFVETFNKGKETVDAYYGAGYTMLLTYYKTGTTTDNQYAKTHLTIRKGELRSEYTLFRKKGYL
jgi:hypothetical protein